MSTSRVGPRKIDVNQNRVMRGKETERTENKRRSKKRLRDRKKEREKERAEKKQS